MKYDSTDDTIAHIRTVRFVLEAIRGNLLKRQLKHDDSKLQEPEKSMYDEYTPRLKGSNKAMLSEMGVALKHHYENNTHHPEHYENGLNGMSLMDVVEMLADWKAATIRHANGDIQQSLLINKERFAISDQLFEILKNTVKEMDW